MGIRMESAGTKHIVGAVLAWLTSSMLLLLLAAFLIGRLKLGSQWIEGISAAVVCLSSAAASVFLFRGRKGERPRLSALLLWVVTAATLLMLGFLIDSDAMSFSGLIRVLVSSLLGSLSDILLKGTAKRKKRGNFINTR